MERTVEIFSTRHTAAAEIPQPPAKAP